ncbi:hypothetical protein DF185_09270 [Marinifilum breve]|uniref:Laminin G domain-containing protein n=2 Tax=Marinifilaceae TaxID=1573805 RepID=A0A2V3ZYW4_9BACT|nr:LamG-like jellyroll fold domain-containing protein [Marinifilum breve]PXY01649.1 hypothetical protein DF185_09270 [Marinifilum breve]
MKKHLLLLAFLLSTISSYAMDFGGPYWEIKNNTVFIHFTSYCTDGNDDWLKNVKISILNPHTNEYVEVFRSHLVHNNYTNFENGEDLKRNSTILESSNFHSNLRVFTDDEMKNYGNGYSIPYDRNYRGDGDQDGAIGITLKSEFPGKMIFKIEGEWEWEHGPTYINETHVVNLPETFVPDVKKHGYSLAEYDYENNRIKVKLRTAQKYGSDESAGRLSEFMLQCHLNDWTDLFWIKSQGNSVVLDKKCADFFGDVVIGEPYWEGIYKYSDIYWNFADSKKYDASDRFDFFKKSHWFDLWVKWNFYNIQPEVGGWDTSSHEFNIQLFEQDNAEYNETFNIEYDNCSGSASIVSKQIDVNKNFIKSVALQVSSDNGSTWRDVGNHLSSGESVDVGSHHILEYHFIDDISNFQHKDEYLYRTKTIRSSPFVGADDITTYSKEFGKITIEKKPTEPADFQLHNGTNEDGKNGAKITWLNCPGVENYMIQRKDVATGDVVDLTPDDRGQFFDASIKTCKVYEYRVKATNSTQSVFTDWKSVVLDDDINDVMQSLEASKGYFNNSINLEWKGKDLGKCDNFRIFRKEYDTNQDVELIKVTNNTNTNAFVDETAEAGTLYEYQVKAIGHCEHANGETVITESNMLKAIGFRKPCGTIHGNVSFKGGNAVENVKVAINRNGNTQPLGSSLRSNGSSTGVVTDDPIDVTDEFTIEFFFNLNDVKQEAVLVSAEDAFRLSFVHDPNLFDRCLELYIGSKLFRTEPLDNSVFKFGEFNHLALVRSKDPLHPIKIYLNGEPLEFTEYNTIIDIREAKPISFIKNTIGCIDEIRCWNLARSKEQIKNNYWRFLSGDEKGLILYWRLDEGLGEFAFDMSKKGARYNKNHGRFTKGDINFSNLIPPISKLSLCGLTDKNGNYSVTGIIFKGTGQTFNIVPMKGIHKFEPSVRSEFISENSLVHNKIDFEDVSSFKVSGFVKYENTDFPVEGVYLKVDGNNVVDSDKKPITTDRQGEFQIDVPIGNHFITVEKQGHVFASMHYPPRQHESTPDYHYFKEPLSGLQFIDTTRVKLAGRIVGGTREGDKKIGFGKSINNIGVVTATLTTEKSFDLDTEELASSPFTTFSTNPKTGEYEVWLLPENYIITKLSETKSKLKLRPVDYGNICNLETIRKNEEVDSVFTDKDGVKTLETVNKYQYCLKKNIIYRSKPQVSVVSVDVDDPKKTDPILSEKSLTYKTENNEEVEIDLFDKDNNDVFGHPVFISGNLYCYQVSAFEPYENKDDDSPISELDKVPVTDGTIKVNTDFAKSQEGSPEFKLDSLGHAVFSFLASGPNLTTDRESPERSYTKYMDMKLQTQSGLFANWPSNEEPYRAYFIGVKPTGNDFVTKGPDKVDFILRDPPGSNSFASIKKGFSVTKTETFSLGESVLGSLKVTNNLGAKTTIGSGVGVMTFSEIEVTDELHRNVAMKTFLKSSNTKINTTTYTDSYKTSNSNHYVGSDADVFLGTSSNIVYGTSKEIKAVKESSLASGAIVVGKHNGHALILDEGIRISPEFNTMFVYTQNHIKYNLIPDLKKLRNNLFQTQSNKYQLVLKDSKDPKYGTNNDDSVWGERAIDKDGQVSTDPKAPSYIFKPISKEEFKATPDAWTQDSVRFYNNQIKQWKAILAQNEREKLESKPNAKHSNISFDAGTVYENSMTTSRTKKSTFNFEFTMSLELSTVLGLEINEVGYKTDLSLTTTSTVGKTKENSETKNKTVSYTLADNNTTDYYTVDVNDCQKGHGPIFKVRGGQTSCPYQGKEATEYYAPGTELNVATLQVEKPKITVDHAVQSNIPANQPAIYNVTLSNESESGHDLYYKVNVAGGSNPLGATVFLGGMRINSGATFLIPAGTSIHKVMELHKSESDTYEDIKIVMHSICQYNPMDHIEDICDSIVVSAHFTAECSPIEMTAPNDKWVQNKESGEILNVTLEGFNYNLPTLEKIDFQYRATSSSQWITTHSWFKNETNSDYNSEDPSMEILEDKGKIIFPWNMKNIADGEYIIRARALCTDGSESHSAELSGIKDMKPPKVFGTPHPNDGILSFGEDIGIRFDETIDAGKITKMSNIEISVVPNNIAIDHSTSLQFDGEKTYARTNPGLQLAEKSFTVEFWASLPKNAEGDILSYMVSEKEGFKLSASENKLSLLYNGNIQTVTRITEATDNEWHHYAIAFNSNKHKISLYEDDEILIDNWEVINDIIHNTDLILGKAGKNQNTNSFKGKLHDLRIWNKELQFSTIYAQKDKTLSGSEIDLIGYYPIDEAFGDLLTDKASARHATTNASWLVEPAGNSFYFDGSTALTANISSIPISNETDMTLECWFRAKENAHSSTLLSNGNPDKDLEYLNKIICVNITENGFIEVKSNGLHMMSRSKVTDDSWHHFSLAVHRTGSAMLFIDGHLQEKVKGISFGCLYGSELAIGGLNPFDGLTDPTNRYTGHIDELKIWNMARSQELMKIYRNTRIKGTSAGIKAYFPFETYASVMNVLESEPSLKDASVDPYSKENKSYCGNLTLIGNENFSDLTPNIKREKSHVSLKYDYVLNDDEFIITPEPTEPAIIERTVMEISVKGLWDMHGNRQESPKTWTAYVLQSPLEWEFEELDLKAKVNSEKVFTATIVNLSGNHQDFSLNMPAWLSASKTSGTIAPNSNLAIEFKIHEGLNVGTYDEHIYLSSNFHYDEKLHLKLNVIGNVPDWTVDPHNFKKNMSFVSKIRINDIVSTDVNDIIGVFVGEECRGVANVEYIKDFDEYFALFTVYADKDGEKLIFRVYDASSGEIYTTTKPSFNFSNQSINGSFSQPVYFECGKLKFSDIQLNKGWTWVSFNIQSEYDNVNTFMHSINATQGDYIVDEETMTMTDYHASAGWVGTLEMPKPAKLYKFFINNGGNLHIDGVQVSINIHEIEVTNGWNRIGYLPNVNMTVNEALSDYQASENDVLVSQTAFAMYDGFDWQGTLTFMEPGRGYLLKRNGEETITFKYPASSMLTSNTTKSAQLNKVVQNNIFKDYQGVTSVLAVLKDTEKADTIFALIDDEVRAKAKLNQDYQYISVFGNPSDNGKKIEFKIKNNMGVYELFSECTYNNDIALGTYSAPVVLRGKQLKADFSEDKVWVCPNPVKERASIHFKLSHPNAISYSMYDITGNLIMVSPEITGVEGINKLECKMNNLTRGIYLVKAKIGNMTFILKVLKI